MNGPPRPTVADARWAEVSRALRTAFGFAQEDLAAALLVSRKTVQRWERGLGAPDHEAELRLFELLAQRRLFERNTISIGVSSSDELRDVLSRARRGRARRGVEVMTQTSPTALIGRDVELGQLSELVEQRRLVTVTGPGGVGKTSLAFEMVRTYRGSSATVVVELVEVRDAALILNGIAQRLNAGERGGRTMRDAVIRSIGDGERLLLLDNLEHLPEAAPIIDDLLASCPQLRILATSRVPLRLTTETEFRLLPLDSSNETSAGVTLFLNIASRWDRSLSFSPEDLHLIADLCARLDGLPLAIELAAARLRAVSLGDLHSRIDRSLAVLGRAPSDRPTHQQTLGDSIAWSFDLLTDQQRDLMVRLGYFVAGCTMSTAETVGSASAFDDVVVLVESGLISLRGDRYRMLETVRDFAKGRRQPDSDDSFVDWAIATAETYAKELRGAKQRVALDALAREYPNLRAALQQLLAIGDGTRAHRLAAALCGYWDGRSLLGEARRWLELTLASPNDDVFQRATLHTWLGYFSAHQNDMSAAAAHAQLGLATWTQYGINAGIGYATLILGRVAAEDGRHADAEQQLNESIRCLRAVGDRWGLIRPLNALGEIAHAVGNYEEALARHREALSMCAALDELGSQPSILCDIAHVSLELGDTAAAGGAADRAMAIASELDNQVGIANALNAQACCHLATGEIAQAVELWAEAEVLHEVLGLPVEKRVGSSIERDRALAVAFLGVSQYHQHHEIGETRARAARALRDADTV